MKKVNLKAKLSLNKETVTKLTENQMQNVSGGKVTFTCPPPQTAIVNTSAPASACHYC